MFYKYPSPHRHSSETVRIVSVYEIWYCFPVLQRKAKLSLTEVAQRHDTSSTASRTVIETSNSEEERTGEKLLPRIESPSESQALEQTLGTRVYQGIQGLHLGLS